MTGYSLLNCGSLCAAAENVHFGKRGQPAGKHGPNLLDKTHLPGDVTVSFCTEEAPAAEVIPKAKGKPIVIVGDSVSKCS